jgi:hypothetical protein
MSATGGGSRCDKAAKSGFALAVAPASQAHSNAFGVLASASGSNSSRIATAIAASM